MPANKPKMHSPDTTKDNIARVAELFPQCVTEVRDEKGNITQAIDFDQLRQELSDRVVDGPRERYHLNWPGKREALLAANAPIAKTLRPCREESVHFDTTQNLFIEGDNLDALKLLQETYLGKIKMIYIDPPYNTGNDFIYRDDFAEDSADYLQRSNQKDDQGARMVTNTETNGRFHSDWLSMMYPRLKLARNLLRDDGVIFISIDDHEVDNLRKLCNEIFGEENFVSQITVQSNPRGRQSDTFAATVHDYLLAYARNAEECILGGAPLSDAQRAEFDLKDEEGRSYRLLGLRQRGSASLRDDRPEMFFPIYVNPKTLRVSLDRGEEFSIVVLPRKSTGQDGRWMWGKERVGRDLHLVEARLIEKRGEYDIFVRDHLERNGIERERKYKTIWDEKAFNTQNGTHEVKTLIESNAMPFPKPLELLKAVINMGASETETVLDFFAGSGTAANAVLDLNKQDGGKRKFILVQLPENCDQDSEAYKAGFRNIAEIGKERIRRVIKNIAAEQEKKGNEATLPGMGQKPHDLDLGFRVLKVGTSNMKDVYYQPDAVSQTKLYGLVDNLKEDRTDEDLLFQVLLDWGVDLTLPISPEKINGKMVYFVDTNALAACFELGIDETFIKELAKRKPLRAVFRDNGYGTDATKINVEQIFKLLSPGTEVKSL